MTDRKRYVRADRKTLVTGMLFLVIVIAMVQVWLLTATLNAYLGGNTEIALPAALVSLVCLGLNVGLLRYLYLLE